MQMYGNMNDDLRNAANLMSSGAFLEAANAYRTIYQTRPDHAAIAASQVGAALFFLRNFNDAIAWYRESGRLGLDPRMVNDNIQEAEEAQRAPYTPKVGDIVLVQTGELLRYDADGTWKPHR
ncbi:MAG: hypothetical protein AAGF12_06590 [Myxococcota bacterium]